VGTGEMDRAIPHHEKCAAGVIAAECLKLIKTGDQLLTIEDTYCRCHGIPRVAKAPLGDTASWFLRPAPVVILQSIVEFTGKDGVGEPVANGSERSLTGGVKRERTVIRTGPSAVGADANGIAPRRAAFAPRDVRDLSRKIHFRAQIERQAMLYRR